METIENRQLGEEKIPKLFLKFALPGVIGMLFMGLYTIIDGIFLGNYVGANALASVNIAFPFWGFIMALGLVVSAGAQSIVGIKLGEGDPNTAKNAFKTGFIFLFVTSIIIGGLTVLFSSQIAVLLGANDILLNDVVDFLKVLGIFIPFYSGLFFCDYSLKAIGKPIFPTIIMILAVVLNIILDYVFIVVLGYGVKGAALGTGIAFTVGFFIIILPLLRKSTTVNVLEGRFSKKLLKRMLYNGSSEGVSEIAAGITTYAFNLALMKYAGEVGVAAFASVNYIAFIGISICLGISDGIRPIVSYNYGYRKIDRIKEVLKIGSIVSLLLGAGIFTLFMLKSETLIQLFIGEGKAPDVIEMASTGARIYAVAFLFNGLNIMATGYFTSIGNAKLSATISILRGIVFILIGILVLPIFLGINGIWMTIPVTEVLTLGVTGVFIYRSISKLQMKFKGDHT